MKLPGWLVALKKEDLPQEVKARGHKYEEFVKKLKELKQELMVLRGRLDELRVARTLLEGRAVEVDASIAQMGLLRRLFLRFIPSLGSDITRINQEIQKDVQDNARLTRESLQLMQQLLKQLIEVREQKNRALIELFLCFEESQLSEDKKLSDEMSRKLPKALQGALEEKVKEQFKQWRKELVVSSAPGGFLERSLSYEELGFRSSELNEQASRIASAAADAVGSRAKELFQREMNEVIEREFSGIQHNPELNKQLSKLFQSAYYKAQAETWDAVSSEIYNEDVDELLSHLFSEE